MMLSGAWDRVSSWLIALSLSGRGVSLGRGVKFYGRPCVSMEPGSLISIGDSVVVCSRSSRTAMGVTRPTVLRTLLGTSTISIGRWSGLSGAVVVAACEIIIGDECLLGSGAVVVDTDFHPLDPKGRRYRNVSDARAAPVMIGSNVFIGANSMILKGVTIGDGSVIGAGSVVVSSIPSGVVAAGNPARVLRSLE